MHVPLHSVPLTMQQATTDPYLQWRLLNTHRQVWVSLLGSLLLSPGSCCTQGSVCALQESISESCVSSGSSMVGLVVTSSKRAYVTPKSAAPLPLWQAIAEPDLCRRCSNTVLSQSLWGLWVLVCTRFVWALGASLGEMGFDSKCEFAPPTILLGLLLCPWVWGILTAAPAPTILLGFLWPWTWNISSWLLQWSTATVPDLGRVVWGNAK